MLENIVWAPRYSLSMLEKWLRTVSLSDEFRPISDGFRLWIKTGARRRPWYCCGLPDTLCTPRGWNIELIGTIRFEHWREIVKNQTSSPPSLEYWDHHTQILIAVRTQIDSFPCRPPLCTRFPNLRPTAPFESDLDSFGLVGRIWFDHEIAS